MTLLNGTAVPGGGHGGVCCAGLDMFPCWVSPVGEESGVEQPDKRRIERTVTMQ